METVQFKDHLSRLATSVSVILVVQGDEIFGCTISSLSASNINNPEIMFTLTKTSQVGHMIRVNQKFSISVLASGQESIAKLFSGPRTPMRLSDRKEIFKQGLGQDLDFITIENSSQDYWCTFSDSMKRDQTELFFAKVIDGKLSESNSLVYQNRRYLN